MEWVFEIFSQIVPSHPMRVSIQFLLQEISDLENVDWARIEHMFIQERWANLERITIHLRWHGTAAKPGAVESIMARLLVLESRGILSFGQECSGSRVAPVLTD
jgi:hypothetical protein